MNYGYARVSSREQNLSRQILAIKECGVLESRIITDKQSGKDFNREGYKSLLRKLRKGDVLYIKSIDRLGRDYHEIIVQWQYLTGTKGIDIVVIDFPLLNTAEMHEGVTRKFLADLVLQVLSYVAQIERENIHQRQMEGIRIAKARGVSFGRKKLPIPDDFEEKAQKYKNGEIRSLRKMAQELGVSHTTVSKWLKTPN
ncbi:recombinase family protein [Streptococcus massiliensis]|uniref:Resolvase/integrase n=1 Tax=Streptococcus massiliensis TaxID=313439 RepID=A0A380L361_9STRE|nr:recombinase family protein [Streptococcus massiliensis]SUN76970.1 resolvase/integrase [Streptococcus massiliensis]